MSGRRTIRVEGPNRYGQFRLRDGAGDLVMNGLLPLTRSNRESAEREAEFVEGLRRSPGIGIEREGR